jgi:hypothetical protein
LRGLAVEEKADWAYSERGIAMAYNDFTLDVLIEQFQLSILDDDAYFAAFAPIAISDLLRQELEENVPVALDISTEKARSELIIMPVLMEIRRQFQRQISIFSGVEFNVDMAQGLRGVCDFLLSLSPVRLTIQAPVVAIVEAKNENMKAGIAQCVAEMLAAQRFNQARGNAIRSIYGVVTTGTAWRFFRLQDTRVYVDGMEHSIENVERIVGILTGMMREALASPSA